MRSGKKDNQITEVIGRNWLVNDLLKNGIEVASPIRDQGIDLIAYVVKPFVARPIQLKIASNESFALNKKYKKFPKLLLVHVWHLDKPNETVSYALTYKDAHKILREKGHTKTSSWKDKGSFSINAKNKKLIKRLEPYKMNERKWRELFKN